MAAPGKVLLFLEQWAKKPGVKAVFEYTLSEKNEAEDTKMAGVCMVYCGENCHSAEISAHVKTDDVHYRFDFRESENMKLNIIKNTRRNLIWGIILRVYQILVPLLIRRVFIYRLGVEYAGLSGLFSSVLNFLNLAEMGVGSAVLFFMYKPIAENDTEAVRRLLGLIHRCYQRIGLFVLAMGVMVTPFIRLLISGEFPDGINIYAIFTLNLLSSVLSYWLCAYKSVILSVHQRNDLTSRAELSA